jgi:hypothetical protein
MAVLWHEAPRSLPEKLIAEDYSLEEGGSVFLRTVAIYIQTHTAVYPRIKHRHFHCCENVKSHTYFTLYRTTIYYKLGIWD